MRAVEVRFPDGKSEVTSFLESLGVCVFWLTPGGIRFLEAREGASGGIRFLDSRSEVTRFRSSGDAWRC
jgi:hypothetical protein